jgi:hypothetical protein
LFLFIAAVVYAREFVIGGTLPRATVGMIVIMPGDEWAARAPPRYNIAMAKDLPA